MISALERLRDLRASRGPSPPAASGALPPSPAACLPDMGTETGEAWPMPADLSPDWRIEWEERAAIREYEGGQAREHAEAEALREIVERMRGAGMRQNGLDRASST